MFLPRTDIFKDLRQEAISDFSELAVEETHPQGTVLFSEGDTAKYFYLLVEGQVRLTMGDGPSAHYMVGKIGEAFGWSSVVGREAYSATAECSVPTKVIKFDRSGIDKVFDAHARSGRVFYKRVAMAMGERWLDLHRTMLSSLESGRATSYGTGQVSDPKED
jgi:CRP-like cAMP-binding protein